MQARRVRRREEGTGSSREEGDLESDGKEGGSRPDATFVKLQLDTHALWNEAQLSDVRLVISGGKDKRRTYFAHKVCASTWEPSTFRHRQEIPCSIMHGRL
eukprot:5739629-Pleurochrysis_carterae.AAC.2